MMNTHPIWRTIWLPAAAALLFSLGIADPGWAQKPNPTGKPQPRKMSRVTQAQREAAAERLAAARKKNQASKARTLASAVVGAQAVLPGPGQTPDYLSPNWAYSPSPRGQIIGIAVTAGGSGYTNPTVTITDPTGTGATAAATIDPNGGAIQSISVTTPGSGYALPTVTITDPAGSGATAVAEVGGTLTGGMRKFVDTLPGLGPAKANNLGQYLPVANPDTITYPGSDYYEIELRQYTEQMHSDLPPTTLRGYVQTSMGTNAAGTANDVPPAPIHYLGPIIIAQKDRAVRVKFTNALSTGEGGNLFIPCDTTVMGAGMGPVQGYMFTQNRATLHLHGGKSPWISDGTPHQWITPAGEATPYTKGVSVKNVPDMPDPGEGAMTFYWTNQQSARFMFYHDHAWGITRLNVYVGEAAGYLIADPIEKELVDAALIPAEQIPLVLQDRSFVDAELVRVTDSTWNWGTGLLDTATGIREPKTGDLWLSHVYVPAQNPYDIEGVNPFGRWHYGPWFWPPTKNITYGPVPNPYYDPVNAPWQPPEIPGTPHPSMGMEMFCDTPVVNGTAYPTLEVEPKAYRFRILNAANDRFFNLQFYEADPDTVFTDPNTGETRLTEVRMVPASPNTGLPPEWPTDGREGGVPDPVLMGPQWIQIANEGGFLPAPAVVPNRPIAWNMDPTTFNFGNVSDHALLLGPAERADVVVDFSAYAGKTLIVYNDAPAAFPALDPRYDYYTGSPDMTDTGGYWGTRVGYGPNTRTVMQIKVKAAPVAPAFDLVALENAFKSTATSQGVFARGQDPIIVGQTAYNSAYNTTFPAAWPNWGVVGIQDNTVSFQSVSGDIVSNFPLEPKAIQDEMGEAFDREYGRMSGNLGLEMPKTVAGAQNFSLYAYATPPVEILKGIVSGTPLATLPDGTQIWKITHNGVDTHPIHFHLYDVQLLNRVGWDGAKRLPDANELGWKETVRISPLEDTIVALRPLLPDVPFQVPNSVRLINPAMPEGEILYVADQIFDPVGEPILHPSGIIDPVTGLAASVINSYINFGWEYVWHCHILSHEEMDMMHGVCVAGPVAAPSGLAVSGLTSPLRAVLTWTDNSANELGFTVQRATDAAFTAGLTEFQVAADATTYTDNTIVPGQTFFYRVFATNTIGDTTAYQGDPEVVGFPHLTVQSPFSNTAELAPMAEPPAAPSGLAAALAGAPLRVNLTWVDNANNETGFTIQRATDSAFTAGLTTFSAAADATAYADATVAAGSTYFYRVLATSAAGDSAWSNVAQITVTMTPPAAPSNLTAVASALSVNPPTVTLNWIDNANNEGGFTIQRSTSIFFTTGLTTFNVGPNVTEYVDAAVSTSPQRYYYRVLASNVAGDSAWSNRATVVEPGQLPADPINLAVTPRNNSRNITLSWAPGGPPSGPVTSYRLQVRTFGIWVTLATFGGGTTSTNRNALTPGQTYEYRIQARNAAGASEYVNFPPYTP